MEQTFHQHFQRAHQWLPREKCRRRSKLFPCLSGMLSGGDLSRSRERTEGRNLCYQQKEDEVWHQGLESRASCPWFVASFRPSQTLPENQLPAYLCRGGRACLCWTCLLCGLARTDTALPPAFPHSVHTSPQHSFSPRKRLFSRGCKMDPFELWGGTVPSCL